MVAGTLSSDPVVRTLPSRDEIVQLEVTTRDRSGTAASVPVQVAAELVASLDLRAGADVVVIGSVRRRFFRAGGSTQSRTEVVAAQVVPIRRRATAAKAVGRACAAVIDVLAPG